MQYNSTRDNAVQVTAAQAIVRGHAEEGGLMVPQSLPQLSGEDIAALAALPYAQRAERILSLFLGDITPEEVADCAARAYTAERFRSEAIAPLHELREGVHILELWHGPTCAFKDMALQILPHLMRVSAAKASGGRDIVILVATSGDTGKAALKAELDQLFYAGCCDDAQTAATIAEVFAQQQYLCDTHTAVGVHVYEQYRRETGDTTPTVIASTANPYKFSASVLEALGGSQAGDEFDKVEQLHRLTGCAVPAPLAGLKGRQPRFTEVCDREDMEQAMVRLLQLDD